SLMRALVASETSGSSRNALETVITETPARREISLSRTMLRRQKAEGRRRKVNYSLAEILILHSSFVFFFKGLLRANAALAGAFQKMSCLPSASGARRTGRVGQ